MSKDFLSDFAKGCQIAVGFAAASSVLFAAWAFASATWWGLPNAGTTLSSTAWNDIVSQLNTLASAMSVSSWDVNIAPGKTLSAGKLHIADTVAVWTACPGSGAIAKDASWTALSCKSGAWTAMWSVGPQWPAGPMGPTGATGPQWPAWTNCWAPQVEIWGCRGSFHAIEMTACDWRICNACGCWGWNPGWRQILLQNPGY